jgi:hypothetical protein
VKGDYVVQPAGVLVSQAAGQETKAGALEDFVMETDAGVTQRKVKAMPATSVASNGGSQNGGKKRKADSFFFSEYALLDVW